MNKDLKKYVLKIENFLSKEFCNQTINQLKKIQWRKHDFYNIRTNKSTPRSGYRELDVSNDVVPNNEEIMKRLHNALEHYLKELNFKWFCSWDGYSRVRYNKYSKGQKMAIHCDHIHNLFTGEKRGIPILSIVCVLNDNYEGGEFIMFDDYEIKFKAGDLIVFPSVFLYPHLVKPVKKGIRYSFVSWAY